MSMQAQIKEWVDDALQAVLGGVLERLVKLEDYVKAIEQADQVPADPAPRVANPARTTSGTAAKSTPAKASGGTTARAATATGKGTAT